MKRVVFDIAALIARIVTGVIFVAHGWQQWQGGVGATARSFGQMGAPLPELGAWYTTVVEIVGGILLILGLLVRPVALLLLIAMAGAIAFLHWGHGIFVQNNGWELAAALGVLSLLFLALGGGRLGLDGLFHSMFRRRGERRVAEEELAAYRRPGEATTTSGGHVRPASPPTTPTTTPPEGHIRPAHPSGEPPEVPRQPSAPTSSSKLNDDDMREIDALVSDDQPQHRKPPNR